MSDGLVSRAWRRLAAPAARPSDLAALRIATFVVVLGSPDARRAVWAAGQPLSLSQIPAGGGFLVPLHGLGPDLFATLQVGLLVAAACALVGLWSRWSAALVALLGVAVFGLPNLFGTVRHVHHLVWFPALLAASPCGDAWSVDAWLRQRRGQPPPPPGPAYGAPLQVAWLLAGCIYAFPGLHKLLAGVGWAWSDNLLHHMRWKWLQVGTLPRWRVDHWPLLVRLGGVAVVLFELSWIVLALVPGARMPLLGATLVFHQVTAQVLFIRFPSLWVLWLGLLPHAWRGPAPQPPSPAPGSLAQRPLAGARGGSVTLALVAALLLGGAGITGVTRTTAGWPFACFPPFATRVGPDMPALRVTVRDRSGRERHIRPWRWRRGDRQRRWGQQWRLVLERDPGRRARQLQAWWVRMRPRITPPVATDAVRVRFYRVWLSTVPEDRGRERRATLLLTLPPPKSVAPQPGHG